MTSETSLAAVRTFLIADVRGYTRFTHEHGDEAAAGLAAAFADLARTTVLSFDGEVIELRGDEALCVFASARQALRAAVELQAAFRRPNNHGSAFPLPVGIGIDAGEAVPVEGGYRGGALNTAARLCDMAGPGQILATDTAVSLARRVEGIRFVGRRAVRLKGFQAPVRVVEVAVDSESAPRRARRPGVLAAVGLGTIALALGLTALAISRTGGREFLSRLDANAVGIIDAEAAGISAQLTAGRRPGAIAAGGGYIWVASATDGTLSRIDPETRALRTARVGRSASGVAFGNGSVWVTNAEEGAVAQVDPKTLRVLITIQVGARPGPVAVGAGAVWVANTNDGTLSRISLDPVGRTETIPVGPSPAGIAVGLGAVWVASEEGGIVLRVNLLSGIVTDAVKVGNGPTGLAVGIGHVWVANRQDGTVSRIEAATNSVSATIRVGAKPTSVAVSRRAVWVANSGDRTIARIDPDAVRVDETVTLDSIPNALALDGGNVWATTLPTFSFDASFRGAWRRSTYRGSLVLTGAAASPSELTAKLSSPSYSQTFRLSVPAGAFDRSFPLRELGVHPGSYAVSLSGVSEGRPIGARSATVVMERPQEGIVTKAWITAGTGRPVTRVSRGTRQLVAHFIYTTKPSPGSQVTASWFLGNERLGAVTRVSWRPLVETTIGHLSALPPGRYTCVLRARGLVVSEASVRVG